MLSIISNSRMIKLIIKRIDGYFMLIPRTLLFIREFLSLAGVGEELGESRVAHNSRKVTNEYSHHILAVTGPNGKNIKWNIWILKLHFGSASLVLQRKMWKNMMISQSLTFKSNKKIIEIKVLWKNCYNLTKQVGCPKVSQTVKQSKEEEKL